MKPQDQDRLEELCSKIANENDPHKFLGLVQQLNDLLEHSQRQLDAARADAVRPTPQHGQEKNT